MQEVCRKQLHLYSSKSIPVSRAVRCSSGLQFVVLRFGDGFVEVFIAFASVLLALQHVHNQSPKKNLKKTYTCLSKGKHKPLQRLTASHCTKNLYVDHVSPL